MEVWEREGDREKEREREKVWERDSFEILFVHTGYLLSIVKIKWRER